MEYTEKELYDGLDEVVGGNRYKVRKFYGTVTKINTETHRLTYTCSLNNKEFELNLYYVQAGASNFNVGDEIVDYFIERGDIGRTVAVENKTKGQFFDYDRSHQLRDPNNFTAVQLKLVSQPANIFPIVMLCFFAAIPLAAVGFEKGSPLILGLFALDVFIAVFAFTAPMRTISKFNQVQSSWQKLKRIEPIREPKPEPESEAA